MLVKIGTVNISHLKTYPPGCELLKSRVYFYNYEEALIVSNDETGYIFNIYNSTGPVSEFKADYSYGLLRDVKVFGKKVIGEFIEKKFDNFAEGFDDEVDEEYCNIVNLSSGTPFCIASVRRECYTAKNYYSLFESGGEACLNIIHAQKICQYVLDLNSFNETGVGSEDAFIRPAYVDFTASYLCGGLCVLSNGGQIVLYDDMMDFLPKYGAGKDTLSPDDVQMDFGSYLPKIQYTWYSRMFYPHWGELSFNGSWAYVDEKYFAMAFEDNYTKMRNIMICLNLENAVDSRLFVVDGFCIHRAAISNKRVLVVPENRNGQTEGFMALEDGRPVFSNIKKIKKAVQEKMHTSKNIFTFKYRNLTAFAEYGVMKIIDDNFNVIQEIKVTHEDNIALNKNKSRFAVLSYYEEEEESRTDTEQVIIHLDALLEFYIFSHKLHEKQVVEISDYL